MDIIRLVICLFAVYGFVMLVADLIEGRSRWNLHRNIKKCAGKRAGKEGNNDGKPHVRMVLLFRNAEDHLEYILRNALKCDFVRTCIPDASFTVIDVGSADETPVMLGRMAGDSDRIEVVEYQNRERIFTEI